MRNHMVIGLCLASICLGQVLTENCDHLGVLFYEELGCSPKGNSNGCPTSYKCNEYVISDKYCNYQGKKYNGREQLPRNQTDSSCNVGCFCAEGEEKARIICAILDCPEWLGGGEIKSGCYRKYNLGSCCSSGEACEPFGDATTCEVDGTVYREGERFSPKGSCYSCVCQKGFSGKYEAPYCKRKTCAFEIRNSDKIAKFCAPVYYDEGETKCCPSTFVCESDTDVIKPGPGKSDKKCKFGSKLLNLGDSFERSVTQYGTTSNVKCSCDLPPYVSCKSVK